MADDLRLCRLQDSKSSRFRQCGWVLAVLDVLAGLDEGSEAVSDHDHQWLEERWHENADRIRTKDTCICGAIRYGCYAKRLEADGFPAWGALGEWYFTVKPPEEAPTE